MLRAKVSFVKDKLAAEGGSCPPEIMREIMLASTPEGGLLDEGFDVNDDDAVFADDDGDNDDAQQFDEQDT